MPDDFHFIGRINADGAPVYPDLAIDGRLYALPPSTVHFIGDGRFVVLDGIANGFDLDAALAELTKPSKKAKTHDDDQPTA